jgi:hypothetical protein
MRLTTLLLVLLAPVSKLGVVIVMAEPPDGLLVEQYAAGDGGPSLRALRGKTTVGGTTNKKCGSKKGCPTPTPTPPPTPLVGTSCPAVSPVLSGADMTCGSQGKKCSFEYETTTPGAICKNKDDCTCKQGKWVCASQIGCIDDAPAYIEKCPKLSPVVSKITDCLDNSKQLCEYGYNIPIPKTPVICAHKDVCTCSGQWQWDCQIDTKCSIPEDRP